MNWIQNMNRCIGPASWDASKPKETTMTDRKLLEDAARAAGGIRPDLGSQWNGSGLWFSGNGEGLLWNPLTDDGDALRLAVKLGLLGAPSMELEFVVAMGEETEAERQAATRLAIVLAAAEIGA